MSRLSSGLFLALAPALTLAFGACSPKAPAADPPRRATPDVSGPVAEAIPAVAVPPPDPREAALSEVVLQLLEQEHLLKTKINDDVSRTAFATYIDRLDGSKMFLLRRDRETLSRHADKLDDQLRSGRLELAHDGAKLFVARVGVVEKLVVALLAAPMDLTNEEWLEIDPKKVELAATEQELRERWRQRLELEVLERVSQMEKRLEPPKPGDKDKSKDAKDAKDAEDDEVKSTIPLAQIPKTPEGREAKARTDLAKTYSGRFARLRTPGPLDAAADVVNAITTTLDPHTVYLPPADKANFDIQMSGSLEGIGAVLRERDHYIEIVELVPGGASWRHGGLSPNDVILSVAAEGKEPVDVFDLRIDEVVKMIRGPKNTVVRLRVQKPDGREETVAITRDVVVIEDAYARGAVLQRKGQPAYGYIHLPSFYGANGGRSSSDDVGRLLGEMKARKVAGVVLDLRSNGGGVLRDSIQMTGHLIDHGPVVQVQDSRGKREVLEDKKSAIEFEGPVVVLVDRFSASASEILAGALQDYKRAIIVGTGPTHGKGTVQTLANLDAAADNKVELGVLKITIQQFFRVSGASTQREGVVPDILLPDPAGHVDAGERELEHAIAWSQIAAAPHADWAATWKTPGLVQRSTARVIKQPLLAKIAATTQLLKARQSDTRIPLARAAWEARREEQRIALEAASPDLKKAPANFTVKVIEEPKTKTLPPPPPGVKPDDRLAKWSENLARDPWVDETLNILGDMK